MEQVEKDLSDRVPDSVTEDGSLEELWAPIHLRGRQATPPKIELCNVQMIYQTPDAEVQAIAGLSLRVPEQAFWAVVGPSGCGKSTLLSLIAGLERPTSGRVLIDGRPVEGPSGKVGYMLQQDTLFEWRTVLDNALLGMEVRRQRTPEAVERVRRMLRDYGLAEFEHRYPRELSGGMRQRVALVRTLAINPDILLLDEPFAALDYQTRLHIGAEIAGILREAHKTVLLVTHDIAEAVALADRVIILSRRPASIKAAVEIRFPDASTPMERRQSPVFPRYFNQIWRELDVRI